MNIEQFIQTTLAEIASGIKANSPSSNKKHFYLDSDGVDFDLAIMVSKEKQKNTKISMGASIKVASLDKDSVNINTEKSKYISRVKFKIRFGNDGGGKVIRPGGTLNKIY